MRRALARNMAVFLGGTLFLFLSGCGRSNPKGSNIVPVEVGSCGVGGYANEPCVAVTLCAPGSSACQTIPNVLLDTGSFGLRVFGSLLTVGLVQENDPMGNPIAECTPYVGGNSDWGPVKLADVVLAGDKASSIPIQVIDAGFGDIPSSCANPDVSPQTAGFNGILGVGVLSLDCGAQCANDASNGVYFTCPGGRLCNSAPIPIGLQVANPVAFLNADNNGLLIQLPALPSGEARTLSGSLILGIGTQDNNTPAHVSVFPTDGNGDFITTFQGKTYAGSYIDSGSNALYFPSSIASLPICGSTGEMAGLFCPNSLQSFTATQLGANRSEQETIAFQIGNAAAEMSSGSQVIGNLAGSAKDSFDWGLPFFIGRTVYVGIEGKGSAIGSGPYWAY